MTHDKIIKQLSLGVAFIGLLMVPRAKRRSSSLAFSFFFNAGVRPSQAAA